MTIKDKFLEPFMIHIDDNQVTLVEVVSPEDTNKEPYEKNIGYYSGVDSAIKKVAKLKLHRWADQLDLAQYIQHYEAITKKLLTVTNQYK